MCEASGARSGGGRRRGSGGREPKTHQWRLYWANSARAIIDVPTVGEFKNGRGEFFDE